MVKPWVPHPVHGDNSPNLFRGGDGLGGGRRSGILNTLKNVVILALACLAGAFGTLVFLCGQVQPFATVAECPTGENAAPTPPVAGGEQTPAVSPPPVVHPVTASVPHAAPVTPTAPVVAVTAPAPGNPAASSPVLSGDYTPPSEEESPATETPPAAPVEAAIVPVYTPLSAAVDDASGDATTTSLPMAAPIPGEELLLVQPKVAIPAGFPEVRPGSHLVLVGTFSDPVNANKLADKLINAGVPVRLKRKMKEETLLTHLQVGPFTSAEEAKKAAGVIESLTGLKVYRIHTDEIVPR